MDDTVTGTVSHLRDGPGGQVATYGQWAMPGVAHCNDGMATKAQNQANRGSGRKVAVVLVLFAVAAAFYIGSFLLMRG